VVCRNGYIRTDNFTCIYCPDLPANSKGTVGCNWVCSLGFVQVGGECVPCVGEPTECGVGLYLGYVEGEQCARCLPCTNAVPHSVFVSAGRKNGPDTCALQCAPGTLVDPAYGLDVFGNPVVCAECSTPQCVAGETYLTRCAADQDAHCAACSECPVGSSIRAACTPEADTVCAPCDPALLPFNAVWTAAGCVQWACADAYYLSADKTACVPCRQPRECAKSDRFEYTSAGCGVCTPCDPALLKPWQCFNGDGECGGTYWCGFVTPVPTTSTTAAAVTTTTTTTTPPPPVATTSAAPLSYATLMTVTLPPNVTLAELLKAVSCPNGPCTVQVVSVKRDDGGVRRRLLQSSGGTVTYEIVVLSAQPVTPVVNSTVVQPVSVVTTDSFRVGDPSILLNATQVAAFISNATQASTKADFHIFDSIAAQFKTSMDIAWVLFFVFLLAGIVVLVCACWCCCRCAAGRRRPAYNMAEMPKSFDWSGVRLKHV
jgi:hypothetical protein